MTRRGAAVRAALAVILTAAGLTAACGDSPVGPTPDGPTLACPADIRVQSEDGGPMSVAFGTPAASGGSPPVSVSCSMASGAAFPVGTTAVTCTAVDDRGRSGTCGFSVIVQGPPRLAVTRFLAFGDSLTSGKVSLSPTFLVTAPESYPYKLRHLLRDRYRAQTVAVLNAGHDGECASRIGPPCVSDGVGRLPFELAAHQPEVLLLMEGTNDLFVLLEAGIQPVISALEAMIREAKGRGVRVLLATIPPQRAGGARQRDRVARIIPELNHEIRSLAQREGVVLVDVFAALERDLSLIGVDDLHPTERGYEVMAQTFFDAIRDHLEEAAAASSWR